MRWIERAPVSFQIREVIAGVLSIVAPEERVFLVGGSIRDLLLGRPPHDIDLAVVGTGLGMARRLAQALRTEARVHAVFDTGELSVGELRVDIAGTRRETYSAPAALPVVAPASLNEDLERRDFTINAMALPLAASSLEEVIDPHGGRLALREGRVSVLHEQSFEDDPTRILRGVELASRLDFTFDPAAEQRARTAVQVLDALSPARLAGAWLRLFEDGERVRVKLGQLDSLGVLATLAPSLPRSEPLACPALAETMRALGIEAEATGRVVAGWLALTGGPPAESSLARRLGWPRLAGLGGRLERAAEALAAPRRVDELEAAVKGLDAAEVALLVATAPAPAAAGAQRVWTAWRSFRLGVRGEDLVAAGVAPGPHIGEALRRTRAARLDGQISATEELAFALGWLRGGRTEA